MDSLKTYKFTTKRYHEEKEKNNVALSGLTLHDDDKSEKDEDKEMALLTKIFKKFVNTNNGGRRKFKKVK